MLYRPGGEAAGGAPPGAAQAGGGSDSCAPPTKQATGAAAAMSCSNVSRSCSAAQQLSHSTAGRKEKGLRLGRRLSARRRHGLEASAMCRRSGCCATRLHSEGGGGRGHNSCTRPCAGVRGRPAGVRPPQCSRAAAGPRQSPAPDARALQQHALQVGNQAGPAHHRDPHRLLGGDEQDALRAGGRGRGTVWSSRPPALPPKPASRVGERPARRAAAALPAW